MENEMPNKEQTGGPKLMTVFIIVLALHVIVIGAITAYHYFPKGENKDVAAAQKGDANPTKPGDDAAPTQAGPNVQTDDGANKGTTAANGEASKPGVDPADAENSVATTTKPASSAATAPETVTPTTVIDSKPSVATAAPAPVSVASPAPAPVPVMNPVPAPVMTTTAMGTYTVKSGDTLRKIAKHNGMTLTELRKINGLKSTTIRVGQVLKIKSAGGVAPMVASAPAMNESATAPATAAPAASASVAGGTTYKVSSGDTLTKIAKKFNTSTTSIMAANKIVDANKLKIGMSLVIPQKTVKSTVSENTVPVAPAQTAQASSPDLVMNK